MHPSTALRPVSLAAALVLAAAPVAGQSSEQPTGVRGQASHSAEPTFDLRFPGGTVDDYVKRLKEVVDNLNVIVMPDAAGVELPPFELRDVSSETALRVMNNVMSVRVDTDGSRSGGRVYTIRPLELRQTSRFDVRTHTILAVQSVLDAGLAPAAMLSAVETALELLADENAPPVRLKFHEDTGILIAMGDPSSIKIVRDVVSQVEASVAGRTQQAAAAEQRAAQSDFEIMRDRFEHLQREQMQLQRELAEKNQTIAALNVRLRTLEAQLEQAGKSRPAGGGG